MFLSGYRGIETIKQAKEEKFSSYKKQLSENNFGRDNI